MPNDRHTREQKKRWHDANAQCILPILLGNLSPSTCLEHMEWDKSLMIAYIAFFALLLGYNVVGGALRDSLACCTPKDLDLTRKLVNGESFKDGVPRSRERELIAKVAYESSGRIQFKRSFPTYFSDSASRVMVLQFACGRLELTVEVADHDYFESTSNGPDLDCNNLIIRPESGRLELRYPDKRYPDKQRRLRTTCNHCRNKQFVCEKTEQDEVVQSRVKTMRQRGWQQVGNEPLDLDLTHA